MVLIQITTEETIDSSQPAASLVNSFEKRVNEGHSYQNEARKVGK